MLAYLGLGERRYGVHSSAPNRRDRWEFQAVVRGRCAPTMPDEPAQPAV